MSRKSFLLSVILVAILFVPAAFASTTEIQDQQKQNANQGQNKPKPNRRRHATRHRRHGIKQDYAGAGKSAGHGGKRFGKNVAHGKPIKGGKALGKGVGGMGKGVGHGTKRVGKRVGRKIKHAVTK